MKIKIIDLLNKIANGEELPKVIRFGKIIYEYEEGIDYVYDEGLDKKFLMDKICISQEDLNEDVEIIEETKKIEKIDFGTLNTQKEKNRAMKDTINKLIDEINNLKDK